MGTRSYAHSDNLGTIGSLRPTVSGRGVERPVYQYKNTPDEVDSYVDSLVDDEDEFEDISDDLHNKIGSNYLGGTDSYDPRGSKTYYGGMYEFAGYHKNTARKGISPFKQSKHSGPPIGTGGSSQAFRTTGNFKRTGTQYGSSRPHKIMTDIEDENIWDICKLPDPMERAFLRHNNRVKKVLNIIKEYVLNEIN